MAVADFISWMADFMGPDVVWYVKRLSGNDTLANETHQAGPYMPREFLLSLFPELKRPDAENPDMRLDIHIDSHKEMRNVRAVWYNNKYRGKTRNETRLTGFGGAGSALLDPDNTGALTIFAFMQGAEKKCHAWICRTEAEEDLAEDRIGPVDPGRHLVWSPSRNVLPSLSSRKPEAKTNCRLDPSEIPGAWLQAFPRSDELMRKAVQMRPEEGLGPDDRLVRRRKCEYELFLSVEEAVEMPGIKAGFESIDEFTARAQSILQRRKSRSGRSLELHTRNIFIEEGLREGREFVHGAESEPGHKPDFLFPSEAAYRDEDFPESRLRMLAVKTTCRERWQQVLNEAGRIRTKHLLTIQEGVSAKQFQEMKRSGLQLVVPAGIRHFYPESVRPDLVALEDFIKDVRILVPK